MQIPAKPISTDSPGECSARNAQCADLQNVERSSRSRTLLAPSDSYRSGSSIPVAALIAFWLSLIFVNNLALAQDAIPTENRVERRMRKEMAKKKRAVRSRNTLASSRQVYQDAATSQSLSPSQDAAENSLIMPALSDDPIGNGSGSDLPWRMHSNDTNGDFTDLVQAPQASDVQGASTLDAFEQLAIQNHPTLNAAVARILAARHEALQAGLAPNPQLGLFIDELGNENDPGLWGAYIQRNVVRGNKLALGRNIKNREANVLEEKFESQVLRIKTDVRTSFYKLLIAQKKSELANQLYEAQQNAIAKSTELFEAGEAPKTDLLQTELQAQKTMILLTQARVTQKNSWRELASVIGTPNLPLRIVTGSLDPIAEEITFEKCLEHIIANSPEIQAATAEVNRVRATVDRELAETIPDYQTQLTLGRDTTSNHFFTGVQIQVPLQICDRNQGNIAAAKAKLTVAQNEVERVKLSLAKRLSTEFLQYESALTKSEMFADSLLPKARQTLDLLVTGYPVEVSFLQLLTAQQTVIDITLEYLDSLNQLWASRLKIEGLLLNDSLSQ